MTPRHSLAIALFCLAPLPTALGQDAGAASDQILLYVSPDGRADWSGTLPEPNADATDGPLPSVAAARDVIRVQRRRLRTRHPRIVVQVRGGTYFMENALTFTAEDGGNTDHTAVYRAYENETPVLSGGRKITGWTVKKDAVDGHDLWTVKLDAKAFPGGGFRQLFVNDQRMPRTRLPEEGFYRFTGLPGVKDDTPWHGGQTQATFDPAHVGQWSNPSDIEVVALHFWIESHLPIKTIDYEKNLFTFQHPSTFRITEAHARETFARYYIENVKEALKKPGQWYLDQPTSTLHYIPLNGQTPENTTVIAPRLSQLVRVVGTEAQPVEHLRFEGLMFAHAEWTFPEGDAGSIQAAFEAPGALYFENARHCVARDIQVRQVSSYGVEFGKGCTRNTLEDSDIVDLGAGGVKLGHQSTHTTVHNNEIGPGGAIYHSGVGVWIGHSGHNRVTHNHIHDFYYTGVSVGWSWGYRESAAVDNHIEYNHIHDLGKEWLSDMGGIYTLGVSPGTVLRYNRIHDVNASNYGGWGLYTDEGSTGIIMENNVVYRLKHSGFHQHYGKENIIRNNIFAYGRTYQMMRTREEEHLSFTFERNIVYFEIPKVFGSNWNNEKFAIDHNCYWRVGGESIEWPGGSLEAWRERGHDVHSIVADPGFKDPENGDFTLPPDSPALKIGFEPIDTSRIGRIK